MASVPSTPPSAEDTASEAPYKVPVTRDGHAYAVGEDSLFLFGGFGSGSHLKDFHAFDLEKKTWSAITATGVPMARKMHAVALYKDEVYVLGGSSERGNPTGFKVYSRTTKQWSNVVVNDGDPPPPGYGRAVAVYGTSMYCFSGARSSHFSLLDYFHAFDFESKTWAPVAARGRRPRPQWGASLVVHEQSAVLVGGQPADLRDIFVFNFETKAWSSLVIEGSAPNITPSEVIAAAVHANTLYVFRPGASTYYHTLDLASSTKTWQLQQLDDKKVIRTNPPIICVHGSSLIILGGHEDSEQLDACTQLQLEE